jgi:hypothetical protein
MMYQSLSAVLAALAAVLLIGGAAVRARKEWVPRVDFNPWGLAGTGSHGFEAEPVAPSSSLNSFRSQALCRVSVEITEQSRSSRG